MTPLIISFLLIAALTAVALAGLWVSKEKGPDGKPRARFRRYAFIPLLLMLASVFTVLFWHYERESHIWQTRDQAQEMGLGEERWAELWDEEEFRDDFWRGLFENDQSEMLQLAIEGIALIALGRWLAYKDEENYDEIHARLDRIQRRLDRS